MQQELRLGDTEDQAEEQSFCLGKLNPAIVDCGEYRCLAYLDNDGNWRRYFPPGEIVKVLHVTQTL